MGEDLNSWHGPPTQTEVAISAFISTFGRGLYNLGSTLVSGLAELDAAILDVRAIGGEFLLREGALASDSIGFTTNAASRISRYEAVSSLATFGPPGTEFQIGEERARDLIYVASTAKYFVDAKKYYDDPSQKNADEWQSSATAWLPFLGLRATPRGIPLSQAARMLRAEGYTRVQRASMLRTFGPDVAGEVGNGSLTPLAFSGDPQPWTSPEALEVVTGRTAAARNQAIRAVIADDLNAIPDVRPGMRLTFLPEYSPYARTGISDIAGGTQIGKNVFGSRYELRNTIIHEELHHRWWKRGIPTAEHHAPRGVYVPTEHFYDVIHRYEEVRGWRVIDPETGVITTR